MGTFNFLGYNLLSRLLNDGVVVHGLDIEFTQQPGEWKEEKFLAIGRNANLHLIEEDECAEFLTQEKERKIHALYYCLDVEENDQDFFRAEDLLKKAITYCQSTSTKLIFASTTEVVDHDEQSIITEDTPISPINDRGKRYVKLEELIKNGCTETSFPYLILRFPTLYGPWQPERFAYQQEILNVERKKGRRHIEDSYKSDVLYIDDATDALVKAGVSEMRSEIIHITTGKTGEWERGIAYINGDKAKKNEERGIVLSNNKAGKVLSFSPATSIEHGITKQIEFNRSVTRDIGRF